MAEADRRVEIVHESLLSSWPRLVRWRMQDAEGAQLRDDLRQAAKRWEEKGRSDDLLWTGTAFKEFELWRERYPGGLTETEQSFAQAMVARAERARRRRRLFVAAVLTLALGVAVVTSSLWRRSETAREQAVIAEQQARDEALRAEASKLLALAQLRQEEGPTEALAYTTASLALADTEEARRFALRILLEAPPAIEIDLGGSAEFRFPTFSPDGSQVAVGGHGPDVAVLTSWGRESPILLPGHLPLKPQWALWASNEFLVTEEGGYSQRAFVWDMPEARLLRTVDFSGPSIFQVGPDTLFAQVRTGTSDREILRLRSWPLPDGEPLELGSVDWTALHPDGKGLSPVASTIAPNGSGWLYAKGDGLYLRPLPAEIDQQDRLLGRHPAEITWLLSLQGEPPQVYTRDRAGEIRMWDLAEGESQLVKVISRPDGVPERRIPDTSGRWAGSLGSMVAAKTDRQAEVWDLEAWPQARPLELRRSTSWYFASAQVDPQGDWLAVTTGHMSRLTFWPLKRARSWVVDGYSMGNRPLAFSLDGRWLATRWPGGNLRLWPLPGSGASEPREIVLPEGEAGQDLDFDPQGRFLFTVGMQDQAWIVPLDGSEATQLDAFSNDTVLWAGAVSPSGQRVATAFGYGQGEKTLRVWDLETGELQSFDLPAGSIAAETGYRQTVLSLAFAEESTLFSAGDGGVWRWDLERGKHESVLPTQPGFAAAMALEPGERTALLQMIPFMDPGDSDETAAWPADEGPWLLDLDTGQLQALPAVIDPGSNPYGVNLVAAVAATGDREGIVRVGHVTGGEPHLLLGHNGPIDRLAISPDGRWIATTGEDDTLRLWPMPDLDRPPFHTLPHDELLTTLRSLTNIRVVEDPESSSGWRVEVGPFPGWETVPTW